MPHSVRTAHNAVSVKAHNVHTLLLALLRQQPISRVRLARETRLSTTTVTNLVIELINAGVVVEEGIDHAALRPGAGRPPRALRLCANGRYALGIDIGVSNIRVALIDLQANVIDHCLISIEPGEAGEQTLERAGDACLTLIERHAAAGREGLIVGLGVGASGLVQSRTGVNVFSPNLDWHDMPVLPLLHKRVGLPVAVDNNVRCMTLAESLYGVGRNVRALACVYARIGVGAGLVVEGELYHGADYGAGEIGHWVMTPGSGELCRCGNRGCLETYISEKALLDKAEEIQPNLTVGRSDQLNVIFDAARDGHLALVEMLEERAQILGYALANLVNVLNPEVVVLGGWLSEAFDLIAPVAESTMRRHAFAGIGDGVDVFPMTFGLYSGVIGAGVLAFDSFFFARQPAHAAARAVGAA